MRSILDLVADNSPSVGYGSGPRIVSENHNTGSINWVGGMTDPGEMLGCGMYQQLRRAEGESDQTYTARLTRELALLPADHRAKIETAMKAAANQRFGVDTTGGRVAVMVAGEPAWHRLGVNIASATDSRNAIVLASQNFVVEKRAMLERTMSGAVVECDDVFGLYRADTGERLSGSKGIGKVYKPIQNVDAFAFLDSVMGEFGGKYHTAGSLFGGRKVWMQCELPEHSFEVVRGDAVQAFATFTNPHDGSGKAWCFPTTNRIVCANTFRTASRERDKGLGIRHTGDVRASIADARGVLGVAVREIDTFRENASEMVRQTVDVDSFVSDLLDTVCEVTAADAMLGANALAAVLKLDDAKREAAAKQFARQIKQREGMLEEILTRYESGTNGVGGIRGTKWGVFNAVTEFADHSKPRRQMGSETDRLSRRFESVLNGDADELKQTAYQMLTMKA